MSLSIEPLTIFVEDHVLDDLRARIRNTRWPDPSPAGPWEQGTDIDYLKTLLAYWADSFDWRAQERVLNKYRHLHAELDGVRIHFVCERAVDGRGIPLVLTHGWPSSFLEYLPLVPLLNDPRAHGIDGPSFDVVIPSLPGYGFSKRPPRTGATIRETARLWHRLMRGLGYERYAAHGTDFGAGVTTMMALDEPDPMIGIHLSSPEMYPYFGADARPMSEAESTYAADLEQWDRVERGYSSIQSTKPQTLSYGLNDSPAGLAAWILEKWRAWSDSGGSLEGRFSCDDLLTLITLYWVTQTMPTAIRDYYDNRWFGFQAGPNDFVRVPTGFAVFASHFVSEGTVPREWIERLYNVQRWTSMPRGGHFAAREEPELLARDIAAFFGSL